MVKKRKNIVFLVIVILSSSCLALNDEIGNPTVPPSSIRPGLIKSPNPIDNTSSLAVTGNVSGMAYFHGNVPYRSATEFGAPLGSEGISSFLRLTAPINPARSQFAKQPYYLPSSTVSSSAGSGASEALRYPIVADNKVTSEVLMPQTAPKTEKKLEIPAASPLYDYSRTRPLSYEPADLDRAISYDLMLKKNKKDLTDAMHKASRGMNEIAAEDKEIKKPVDGVFRAPQSAEPTERLDPLNPLQPGEVLKTEAQKPVEKKKDVYGQMLEEAAKAVQQKEDSPLPREPSDKQKQEQAGKPEEKGTSDLTSELGGVEEQTAKAVGEIYKSFATESKDKFNYYMRTAEGFLKQGKYYNAVDAYTLATVYKPDDPLAYAGRSHALFASGEYMSSAYFLARAINIFPQYVYDKIDLNAMIPDANRLENRIEDIKTWIERTNSAELSFLLAYIYYQLDKNELAIEAINFSAEKMPNVAAVKALKEAIEKKPR